MEFLKNNWFVISFVATPMFAGLVWLLSLSSKTFDSPEQKVEHVNYIKNSLTPVQQQRAYLMDSLDKDSAIKTRATRLNAQKKNDSIRFIKDSIVLDYVQKNAEQIFQIREQLEQR